MIYLTVALGSAVGGMLRYAVATLVLPGSAFPWATLLINIGGSFLIAYVGMLTGPAGQPLFSSTARLFLMAGVCGGFTTFSTFSLQTVLLLEQGRPGYAALNVLLSVGLCLAGIWLGVWCARATNTGLAALSGKLF